MKTIQLTQKQNELNRLVVNVEKIEAVYHQYGDTVVQVGGRLHHVAETTTEVMLLIAQVFT